jgi:disulfide bond formation protein DsbB
MNMMSSCGMNMGCNCRGDASIFKLVTLISLIALGAVFAWEYSATIKPCILCVYERYPYGAALVVSIFALWHRKNSKLMLHLLTFIFLISLGLSCYHIAVEQNLLGAPAACMTEMTGVHSVFDVAQQVGAASTRLPCNQAAITFLGLSLTVYNAIVSFLLVVGLIGWSRKRNTCVAECCSSNSCSTNTQNSPCEPRG